MILGTNVMLMLQGGAFLDELDTTLHKHLNASLSTFSIAQLSLLVSPCTERMTNRTVAALDVVTLR